MTDYTRFSIEQFATDKHFREWVLAPTAGSVAFWEDWLLHNPERQTDINHAKALILTLSTRYKSDISDEIIANDIHELVKIARSETYIKPKNRINWYPLVRIAAMLVVAFCVAWLYFTNHSSKNLPFQNKRDSAVSGLMLVRINNSEKEMTVLLSDNSVATLMQGSKLTYPSRFTGDERRVLLSGEAFFDISKDAKRPFLVYANETVTKVLGTSFRVKAFEQDPEVMVLVKTGRVSVYPQKDYELLSRQSDRTVSGVILNPNQQVVFRKKYNRLEKSIVFNPGMLTVSSDQQQLIFDDKPVAEVLNALEKIYGIVIVFDAESLASCMISTQFDEENLKQRMSVICQAIGATYEMIDGQIIVNGKGCSS